VSKCVPGDQQEVANNLSNMLLTFCVLNNFDQLNEARNINLSACMFDFVRAHPPVLDGGAAAGQKSCVLFMKFCQQDSFVLTASHPWL
jgi:hypothetical protein